jgi:hypothetical protein
MKRKQNNLIEFIFNYFWYFFGYQFDHLVFYKS